MSDFIWLFIIAFILIGWAVDDNAVISEYNNAIEKCEQHLPRNQHCEITAIRIEK